MVAECGAFNVTSCPWWWEPATAAETSPAWVKAVQDAIKGATAAVNEFFGTDANISHRADVQGKVPAIEFNKTYGCRIFECWPQVVGGIALSHDGGGSVATFDVTWAYNYYTTKIGSTPYL